MPARTSTTGSELFIVDNSDDDWKVLRYLHDWCQISKSIDIATGYFEIGALLGLRDEWQKVEHIRILMGDEVSLRTKDAFVQGLDRIKGRLDDSLEAEKQKNDFLSGVPAIVEGIRSGKITCRVYRKNKFHAKAYITHARLEVVGPSALVGSSNLTLPGLTENVELNVQITGRQVTALQEWYDRHWNQAEDVTPEILRAIERHTREYSPFEVYARSLFEYFNGKEKSQDEWEATESVIYPLLSRYQADGYHRALQIADEWKGALICDGVGLGKTFIGLMILERCIHEGKRVLLIVPKSAEQSVWMANIRRYLAPKYRRFFKELFDVKRHTDFGRETTVSPDDLDYFQKYKQVILIDEAHHFRNPLSNRGELLMRLAAGKQLYFLTATPINNSLDDLYHLINYFAQKNLDHFKRIGIHNLRKHFLENEKRLEADHADRPVADAADGEDFLRTDELLNNVLIQRSRKYVMESESQAAKPPLFPERQPPRVINYSLKNVYATLYGELTEAFDRENPFVTLAIYNTARYHRDPDKQLLQQQTQVIGLIRTLLLKRLESSFKAFEASVEDLLSKMARFLKTYWPQEYQAWENTNTRWWAIVQRHVNERLEREEAEEEDELPELQFGFDPKEHDLDRLHQDTKSDMELLTGILSKIYRRFYVRGQEGVNEDPEKDEKLQKLLKRLQTEPEIQGNKLLIFTEFRDTARYLHRQLTLAGINRLEQVDSGRNVDNREFVIKRFAPWYNYFGNAAERASALDDPIDILISTDVLSEGLNLQDAALVLNYDLHWNPVRLMQRIGRVDRRLSPDIEAELDRPTALRGKVFFWNFLPPDELEEILHLKRRLDGKILRINKTLGIEGALLTPDDPEMTLKEFNERYEGRESVEELMSLERQRLESAHPELWAQLPGLPSRVFSGKAPGEGFEPFVNRKGETIADLKSNTTPGVFFCFQIPPVQEAGAAQPSGVVRWYFYEIGSGHILEGTERLKDLWAAVRCVSRTKRKCAMDHNTLSDIRAKVEKHIKNSYLKQVQAPIGVKPILKAWMELS
jgi:superfamily II DNA or RNA helicase